MNDDRLAAQPIMKRSVSIRGRQTSVSLEDIFFSHLTRMARERKIHLSKLIDEINQNRCGNNLSSKLRVAVVDHLEARHG